MHISRVLRAVVFVLMLAACGGSPPPTISLAAWLNQTHHTDAQLQAIWREAQSSIAQQVDLNPLQRSLQNAAADLLPGDPRALRIGPPQLLVAPQDDISSADLLALTGKMRPDPTGMIACPTPCNVRYAVAYSLYTPARTRYAASWERDEANFRAILEYEFENQILYALGYNVRWR